MSTNETTDRWSGEERAGDKAIVQALVQDQLTVLAPEDLADLPVVFDTVYKSAELQLDGAVEKSDPGDGLPFDASFVLGTALSSAVWIVSSLIRAYRIQASPAQRDELMRQLGEQVGSEARVRELEEQVGRLLEVVDGLSDALDDRERTLGEKERDLVASPSGSSLSLDPTEPSLPPLPPLEAEDRPSDLAGPDLVLLVVEQGPVAAKYYLLGYRLLGHGSGGEPIHLHCPPHILRRAPGPYIAEILAGGGAGPAAVQIGKLGTFLGERLLPRDLRQRLRDLVGLSATLQVFPEEPAIPWEILRLPAADGEEGASPFLADVFALSQWPGDGTPALRLGASRIALIAPGDSALPGADAEVAFLEGLALPGREVVRIPARYGAVSEALASGGFDVFHFTGHGVAPGDNPDRWNLVLERGERLTPVDLANGIDDSASRPPLVFLNACHSAREGWVLTGIGGLAAAFLEAGAGAVVGANWAVSDDAARTFCESFYQHFLAGTPIAEAAGRARRSLRRQPSSDPTSLAYTVLAHPMARCSVHGHG